jgi:ABC-2 type transport system permease protein
VRPKQQSESRRPEPAFGFWRRSYAMLVKEFIQLAATASRSR